MNVPPPDPYGLSSYQGYRQGRDPLAYSGGYPPQARASLEPSELGTGIFCTGLLHGVALWLERNKV